MKDKSKHELNMSEPVADGSSPLVEMLRSFHVLSPGERLEDGLRRPFSEFQSGVIRFLRSTREQFTPDGADRPMFLYLFMPFQFHGTCFSIIQQTESAEVKVNARKLCKLLDDELADVCRPFIFSILRWDWERRAWRAGQEQNKLAVLRKLHSEVDQELREAPSEMISKYARLVCEYGLDLYQHALNDIDKAGLSSAQREGAFKAYADLEDLKEKFPELRMLDEEEHSQFQAIYKSKVASIVEGIYQSNGRFDGLLQAFIGAQQDFQGFLASLLDFLDSPALGTAFNLAIQAALESQDIDSVIRLLNGIIGNAPYQLLERGTEASYHLIVHTALLLAGCHIRSEVSVSGGRLDARLELTNCIYIIEFKLQDADRAVKQIFEKGYGDAERINRKKTFALGLVFDTKRRAISQDYLLMEIPV